MEQLEIYKKLKSLRKERGLTLNNLAEKIGSDYQQLSRIERGKTKLTLGMLMKMANAFETPWTDIVEKPIEEGKIVNIPRSEAALFPSQEMLSVILQKIETMIEEAKISLTAAKKASIVSQIYKQAYELYQSNNDRPGVEKFIDFSVDLVKTIFHELKL